MIPIQTMKQMTAEELHEKVLAQQKLIEQQQEAINSSFSATQSAAERLKTAEAAMQKLQNEIAEKNQLLEGYESQLHRQEELIAAAQDAVRQEAAKAQAAAIQRFHQEEQRLQQAVEQATQREAELLHRIDLMQQELNKRLTTRVWRFIRRHLGGKA